MAQSSEAEREQRAARLADAVAGRGQSRQGSPQRLYRIPAPGVDVTAIARGLVAWYQLRLVTAQIIAEQPDLCIVRCRSAPWRQVVGRAFELTVELRRDESDLLVGIGLASGRAAIPLYGFQLPASPAAAAWRATEQQLLANQSLVYIRSLLWRQRVRGIRQRGVLSGPAVASRDRARPARELEAVPADIADTAGRPEVARTIEPSPVTSAERIDINAATLDELMGLPGMDRLQAGKVLAAREATGGFTGVQQLLDAVELKPHVLVQLRPRLTVGKVPRSGTAQARAGRAVDRLTGPGRVIDL